MSNGYSVNFKANGKQNLITVTLIFPLFYAFNLFIKCLINV